MAREAEARLKVTTHVAITLGDGKAFTASAVGTPNVQGLQSALVLSGLAR